jgi:hypothetical protein
LESFVLQVLQNRFAVEILPKAALTGDNAPGVTQRHGAGITTVETIGSIHVRTLADIT